MEYYPENTTAHFVTKLPQHLNLQGEWVVGLTEIQIPLNFQHISDSLKNNYISFVQVENRPAPLDALTLLQVHRVQEGIYDKVEDLLQQFNNHTADSLAIITGDVFTRLLRNVTISSQKYNYGSILVKNFSPPNYFPLLNSSFETIEIDIRDQFGNHPPFDYGTVTLTLHFKRVQ